MDRPPSNRPDLFREAYSRAREASLDRPILVALGDDLVLLRHSSEDRIRYIPASFHLLKSIAHAPITVYLCLASLDGGDGNVDSLKSMIAELEAQAHTLDPSAQRPARDALTYAGEMLERASDGHVALAALQAFAERTGHAVLRLTDHATALQLDALDRATADLIATLAPEERDALVTVVGGVHQARDRNLAIQYFRKLLRNSPDVDDRVVFAEGAATIDEAKRVILTRRIDRKLASAFFGDAKRLQRDVLGDAAALRLRSFETKTGLDRE